MRPIHYLIFLLSFLTAGIVPASAGQGEAEHMLFFSSTQYPLKVYFLKGQLPGPTVYIQGGIQGDEPSGYLSAQLLTSAKVLRGNLLIVPRANMPSVLHNTRQVNVDMNRRFDKDYNRFYEDRLARLIRKLLRSCDALIHLHEGSGFYRPTYVDSMRNPHRYGQSIIIDAKKQKGIVLSKAVNQVLNRLNTSIIPRDFRFTLFNTDTFSRDTKYPEQKKSLTYFAMNDLGIPALAIEVSKDIRSLNWKVRHHLKATEQCLELFGVKIQLPDLSQEAVERYLANDIIPVAINGKPLSARPLQSISLSLGEEIQTKHMPTPCPMDPAWGVFASDRPQVNLLSVSRLALAPFSHLLIKKDGKIVGRVNIDWKGKSPATSSRPLFVCRINDEIRYIPSGGTLTTVEGDRLIMEGIWKSGRKEVLNVKGYVSNPTHNTGQDLGDEIILDPQIFLSKYLKKEKTGWSFRIVRETKRNDRHWFRIRVKPLKIRLVHLTDRGGASKFVEWRNRSKGFLKAGTYILEDVWSNSGRNGVMAFVQGKYVSWNEPFAIDPSTPLQMEFYQARTARFLGRMEFSAVQAKAGFGENHTGAPAQGKEQAKNIHAIKEAL